MFKKFSKIVLYSFVSVFLTLHTACQLPVGNFMQFFVSVSKPNFAVEELSESEAELMESGPLSLPVTIAKLDSVDISKVSVSVEEINASFDIISPEVKAASQGQYIMTITGAAGAVSTPSQTPYVVGFLNRNFIKTRIL